MTKPYRPTPKRYGRIERTCVQCGKPVRAYHWEFSPTCGPCRQAYADPRRNQTDTGSTPTNAPA